ncbi:TPA: hypothetical protein ACHJWV_004888, partial [Escherichia coli]
VLQGGATPALATRVPEPASPRNSVVEAAYAELNEKTATRKINIYAKTHPLNKQKKRPAGRCC